MELIGDGADWRPVFVFAEVDIRRDLEIFTAVVGAVVDFLGELFKVCRAGDLIGAVLSAVARKICDRVNKRGNINVCRPEVKEYVPFEFAVPLTPVALSIVLPVSLSVRLVPDSA